tara:strand:- start:1261 stop:1662 length:402 start_codon:yes stop_codon:yes gene_type:complete
MFSPEILKGILLASGRPELTIYRNEKKHIGYEIRLRVNLRADNLEFLDYVKLGLEELNINSKVKSSESKIRPKPILWISGIINVIRVCELMESNYPSSKGQWVTFKEASQMIYRGDHTTQDGFDELLKLKGEI